MSTFLNMRASCARTPSGSSVSSSSSCALSINSKTSTRKSMQHGTWRRVGGCRSTSSAALAKEVEKGRLDMSNLNRTAGAYLPEADPRHPLNTLSRIRRDGGGVMNGEREQEDRGASAAVLQGGKENEGRRRSDESVSGGRKSRRRASMQTMWRPTTLEGSSSSSSSSSTASYQESRTSSEKQFCRQEHPEAKETASQRKSVSDKLMALLTPDQKEQLLAEMRCPMKLRKFLYNRYTKFQMSERKYQQSKSPTAMHTSWYRRLISNKRPPNIHDPPVVRRPGDLVRLNYVIQNWWTIPAVGFNAILQIPMHKFEVWEDDPDVDHNIGQRHDDSTDDGRSRQEAAPKCFGATMSAAASSQQQSRTPSSAYSGGEQVVASSADSPSPAHSSSPVSHEVVKTDPCSAALVVHNHIVANTGVVISRDLKSVVGEVIVPNDIFGAVLRKDLIYWAYWWYRKALAGYDNTIQYNKYDWPCTNHKHRRQIRSGNARMGLRTGHIHWEGSFVHPIRPKDLRRRCHKRQLWIATKSMLSAKFAQGEIILVKDFNISSHKTKHVVQCFRRLVGDRCNSALCCHEGTRDVNDNFRWATAHIAAIRRCNVEGLDVYKLLKYRYLILTELGLKNLIFKMQNYPKQRGWGPKYATPDGRQCTYRPPKVPGWNAAWKERKERLRNSEFRAKLYAVERKKWKWSSELEGALKIKAEDPLYKFRIKNFGIASQNVKPWAKLEDIYLDDEPLENNGSTDFSEEVESDPDYMVDGSALETAGRARKLMLRSKEAVRDIGATRLLRMQHGEQNSMATLAAGDDMIIEDSSRTSAGSSTLFSNSDASEERDEHRATGASSKNGNFGSFEGVSPVWRDGARFEAFRSTASTRPCRRSTRTDEIEEPNWEDDLGSCASDHGAEQDADGEGATNDDET
ncbi:unnamed protein product [Amoebophrya sp. A25]|nr:unnamed protein product [Amoebophrya sp. A25]|eukprot:GSA25T00013390001.1